MRECRNVYFYKRDLERALDTLTVERFAFIHGDPTFSNLMLRGGVTPVFIDPRGYFGYTELHGDPNYDWAKLYYSVVGNYDQFNRKNFRLAVNPDAVELAIGSNGWESLEEDLFAQERGRSPHRQAPARRDLAVAHDLRLAGPRLHLWGFLQRDLSPGGGIVSHDFDDTLRILAGALRTLDQREFTALERDAVATLERGNKLVFSGLGKNVPICEKLVGTLNSVGLAAAFVHTNSAVHGDLGVVRDGDLVVILTKSGETAESVHLSRLLRKRGLTQWLLTFSRDSILYREIPNRVALELEHEGDGWNILPNNSTVLNLIVLQGLAMALIEHFGVPIDVLHANHPGGAIGAKLQAADMDAELDGAELGETSPVDCSARCRSGRRDDRARPLPARTYVVPRSRRHAGQAQRSPLRRTRQSASRGRRLPRADPGRRPGGDRDEPGGEPSHGNRGVPVRGGNPVRRDHLWSPLWRADHRQRRQAVRARHRGGRRRQARSGPVMTVTVDESL